MYKIAVLSTTIPNLLQELVVKLPNLKFEECKSANNPIIQNADIIIADYPLIGPELYNLNNLKLIQGTWAGIDSLLPYIQPNNPPKIPILRYSGLSFGRIMSEYVVTCITNHERSFLKIYDNQKLANWDQSGNFSNYRTIADLNVGILGLGHIGSKLGEILNIFGANIYGLGRRNSITDEFSFLKKYYTKKNLPEFLSNIDYLINVLPATSETEGMLNGNILENCKSKNPVFINIGRGSIVDDNSLINAINKNWISAAYLDVFNTEPLPKDHQFWKMPQIKITPHVAGMSRAKDIAEQFAQNFQLFTENKPLTTLVDFTRGY